MPFLSVGVATVCLLWCFIYHHVTSSPTNNEHWKELLEVLNEIQEEEIVKISDDNETWSVHLNSSSDANSQNATNAGNWTMHGLEKSGDDKENGTTSLVINGPVSCNFEHLGSCPFSQDTGDSTDWTTGEGATPSYMTGPSSGHGNIGKYIYLEATGLAPGNNAILLSPIFAASSTRCVKFSYHMYGLHTGILKLMRMYNRANIVPIWVRVGNQGNTWQTTEMTVIGAQAFQIAFEAVRGNGFASDIALDDLSIIPGVCGQAVTTPTTTPTTRTTPTTTTHTTATVKPGTKTVFTCDFDDNTMCAFHQRSDDDFDWQLTFGSSSSVNTGPQGDQSGTGFYLLMEASEPRVKGSIAKIQSHDIKLSGCTSGCLSFWFHISGNAPGMLRVSKAWTSGGTQHNMPLWLSDESGSPQWRHVTVSLSHRPTFKIVFSGHVNGWQGDIGIDDITLTHGACPIA